MSNPIFDAPLALERNAPCFCGSGQRFKHCCGSADARRRVPHGIEMQPGFLDAATCKRWVDILEQRPRAALDVFDHDRSTQEEVVRSAHSARVTDKVDTGDLQVEIEAVVRRAFTEWLAPRWGCRFAWFEQPTILRYTTGGKYDVHADADAWTEEVPPRRVLDRDGSLLIYLNDAFTGGNLNFVNFEYQLRPVPGLLVAFPSDERYAHWAMPTTSGVRYALVSWAYAHGRPRVRNHPPKNSISLGTL
jgi:predicted 2-oxoglutarate/Fe(II)-dependent dioxygenase YbiX